MSRPQRHQRRRSSGWRKPAGAVIVDRTSRWGNPFTVAGAIEHGYADNEADAHKVVVKHFRSWLLGEVRGDQDVYYVGKRRFDRRWMREHLHELKGRDVVCPCSPERACHGDELMDLANTARAA